MVKKLVIICFLVFALFTSGCSEAEPEQPLWARYAVKLFYAGEMGFLLQVSVDGVPTDIFSASFALMELPRLESDGRTLNELVFVGSEADALGFPDTTVVAWPRDMDFMGIMLEGLNWAVKTPLDDNFFLQAVERQRQVVRVPGQGVKLREQIQLKKFGLSYPITLSDMIDDFGSVQSVWVRLTEREQNAIIRDAASRTHGGPRLFPIRYDKEP